MERFGPVDFDRFHRVELAERLAACDPVDVSGLRPLCFRLTDGRAYTYVPTRDGIEVAEAEEGASTIVVLAQEDWCDFMWELRSCFALLYAGALEFAEGGMGQLARWEPVLRAVYDGQAVYDLYDPPTVVGRDGGPLDLDTSFSLGDSDDEMRDFLQRAGFLHLRGVFGIEEVEGLNREVDAAVEHARPDDQRSWWTKVQGKDVCCRVNYLDDRSETVAALAHDPRLARIGALGGDDLKDAADRLDGHSVVIKVPGASSGLSDLPWHRDCGMGGHPVKCPMLNIGIQLDAATREVGQLQMIAGSHIGTSRLPGGDELKRLPVVFLDTAPGDVTVHWGHTLHAAPPPADEKSAGRRALYATFVQPLTFEMVGPGEGYNDVLFAHGSGRVQHVKELSP
jgi:hypothetical protein